MNSKFYYIWAMVLICYSGLIYASVCKVRHALRVNTTVFVDEEDRRVAMSTSGARMESISSEVEVFILMTKKTTCSAFNNAVQRLSWKVLQRVPEDVRSCTVVQGDFLSEEQFSKLHNQAFGSSLVSHEGER